MGSSDIQRSNAHGDHEPICSRRRESALISAFDGARWRGLTSAATEPRFMESIDIQRFNAHWTHEPGNVQRPTSNAQRSTKRFVKSWMLNVARWTFGLQLCPSHDPNP
jgi:hypothetical protein